MYVFVYMAVSVYKCAYMHVMMLALVLSFSATVFPSVGAQCIL